MLVVTYNTSRAHVSLYLILKMQQNRFRSDIMPCEVGTYTLNIYKQRFKTFHLGAGSPPTSAELREHGDISGLTYDYITLEVPILRN